MHVQKYERAKIRECQRVKNAKGTPFKVSLADKGQSRRGCHYRADNRNQSNNGPQRHTRDYKTAKR